MLPNLLIAIALLANEAAKPEPPEKPPCAQQRQGQLWPDEANRDPKAANRFAREGRLEICSHGPWRYRWTNPSVNIRQLEEKARKKKPSGP